MAEKKAQTPMEKLTKGYEKLMEGKSISKNGKSLFDAAIKKAAKVKKQHGSK